jgi:hypothetical protein
MLREGGSRGDGEAPTHEPITLRRSSETDSWDGKGRIELSSSVDGIDSKGGFQSQCGSRAVNKKPDRTLMTIGLLPARREGRLTPPIQPAI